MKKKLSKIKTSYINKIKNIEKIYKKNKRVILENKYIKCINKFLDEVIFCKKMKKIYGRVFRALFRSLLIFFSFLVINQVFNDLVNDSIKMSESADAFSIIYISVISLFIISLPRLGQLIMYSVGYIFLSFIIICQYLYNCILSSFLSLTDFSNASEGIDYLNMIVDHVDMSLFYNLVILILIYIITFKYLKNKERLINKIYIKLIIVIVFFNISLGLFYFSHSGIVNNLDSNDEEVNDYSDVDSDYNIYVYFNDKANCMALTGIYEYLVRDVYLYIKNNFASNIDREQINEFLIDTSVSEDSEYKDLYKDKNVIFIMMETMDTWIINEKSTPTIDKLSKDGFSFINHYAPPFGGGSTFNSEHAVNTGLYIPNNGFNIYNSSSNYYPDSLANLFNKEDYITSSIHGNSGEFYDRVDFHKTYGYDNSYFSEEIGYTFLDDSMLLNSDIYSKIVPSTEDKFMSFVTTYTGHGPFGDGITLESMLEDVNEKAKVTDDFVEGLIDNLERDGILDDTVLVLFGDHYAYTFGDIEYLRERKIKTDDYEMYEVPFIIWSNDKEGEEVEKYTDQQDMIPIISNLFGLNIEYDSFLGTDVFSENHNNFVYFNDFGYIGDKEDNVSIYDFIEINDNIIIDNYFKYVKNEKNS